jgi:phage-related protein
MRRKGISVVTGDIKQGTRYNAELLMQSIDQINSAASLQEQKSVIKNTITVIASATGATDDSVLDAGWKWNWNGDTYSTKILQLLKNMLMQFLEAFLTPRVVLIFLINFKFANGELPKTPLDFLSAFLKMLWPVIKSLVDFFINYLFEEVLKRVKELMEIYLLKLALEQLEKYKTIVLALIDNCTLNLFVPYIKKTQLIGNIDNVVGADILETKSSPDKDNC